MSPSRKGIITVAIARLAEYVLINSSQYDETNGSFVIANRELFALVSLVFNSRDENDDDDESPTIVTSDDVWTFVVEYKT